MSSRRPPAAKTPRRSASSRAPAGRQDSGPSGTPRRPGASGSQRTVTKRASVRPLRVALLAGILVILSITLVPTIHSYLHQRSQISALRQHIDEQRQHVKALRQERARWDDPQYVEQQARERLKFVFPGEKSYTVLDDRGRRPASTGEPGVAEVTRNTQDREPWWSQVWTSVQIADSGAQQQPPAPRKKATQRAAHQRSKPLAPIRDHRNSSQDK